jgi:hypothetical protein
VSNTRSGPLVFSEEISDAIAAGAELARQARIKYFVIALPATALRSAEIMASTITASTSRWSIASASQIGVATKNELLLPKGVDKGCR